jgi:hypothetical protein
MVDFSSNGTLCASPLYVNLFIIGSGAGNVYAVLSGVGPLCHLLFFAIFANPLRPSRLKASAAKLGHDPRPANPRESTWFTGSLSATGKMPLRAGNSLRKRVLKEVQF